MDNNRRIEQLENKLNEAGIIAFRCNESFYGMYKAERESKFSNRVKIHSEGETFLLCNDKNIGAFGDVFYRINDAENLFFEGMILIGSIARAVENGVLEEIDYKKPQITVHNIDKLSVKKVAMN